jgi:hypothetical protein
MSTTHKHKDEDAQQVYFIQNFHNQDRNWFLHDKNNTLSLITKIDQ